MLMFMLCHACLRETGLKESRDIENSWKVYSIPHISFKTRSIVLHFILVYIKVIIAMLIIMKSINHFILYTQ